MAYYDRYKFFRKNGQIEKIPFIPISSASTDILIEFDKNLMRLDTLSYKYYGDADYAWLIMQANPHFPPMEFSIPDKSPLRIPYPLTDAIARYEKGIMDHQHENF